MIDFDDSLLTNWFRENELPVIETSEDLLRVFGMVKSRFNGAPDQYTRNDYLIFINAVYAALKELYKDSGLTESIQAKIDVGFVNKGDILPKGTTLQELAEKIFLGDLCDVTYEYYDVDGKEIKAPLIVEVPVGDILDLSVINAPKIKGYEIQSVRPVGQIELKNNMTVRYVYSEVINYIYFGNLSLDEVPGQTASNYNKIPLETLKASRSALEIKKAEINTIRGLHQNSEFHFLMVPKDNVELIKSETKGLLSLLFFGVDEEDPTKKPKYLLGYPTVEDNGTIYKVYFYYTNVPSGFQEEIIVQAKNLVNNYGI